jgi:carboxypeptidase Taq
MTFARIDDHLKKLESLDHAQAMLGVDEAVNMPTGGGEKRAEAMSTLAAMTHEMASAPHIADWIADAEGEALGAEQVIALKEFKRTYVNLTCLSSDFVGRQVEARMKSEQLWRKLRAHGNWRDFLPSLETVVALAREEAALRAAVLDLSPYDALIEQYDPGSRVAQINPVFDELKNFLKTFVPEAIAAQKSRPRRAFTASIPVERQKSLGGALMKAIGFDFDHGRLDVSDHPFCGGVPSDVRMTTRYSGDGFLLSLMGILHETGHGLYEQGLPSQWSHWPCGKARGMAAHESQSLFVEMQMARNPAFWEFALPLARQHLGAGALEGWSLQDVLAHVHRVERGLIRVEADECTYPLHVILRFEIEQDLIAGKLAVKDLPEAWHAKMQDYLGLSTIDNAKDGPLQDVHWPAGAFGYFPSYTLGALMAAQQWAAIERQVPDVADHIRSGDFSAVNNWRQKNIWSKASFVSTPELMTQATGAPLNAKYFIAHVKKRYLT